MRKKYRYKLDKSMIFRRFLTDLKTRYGSETAAIIWRDANLELQRLVTGHRGAKRRDLTMIFPAVALYRAIESRAPGEALEVTRALGTKAGSRLRDIFLKLTSLPGIPALIWKKMPAIARKLTDGYECEDVVVDNRHCSLRITGCPIYNRTVALGCPEAAQLICCLDKEYLNGFRGVKYTRTKSLAEGDAYCDYLLEKSRDRNEKNNNHHG